MKTLDQRFWEKVDKLGEDECWNWKAGTRRGYGDFRICVGKIDYAHRVSYCLHKGVIPSGMLVCHSCDNPLCVNPKHLFIGTNLDNILDRNSKQRTCRGERFWSARLKESDIKIIREMYASGRSTVRKLSKKFSVHHNTIYAIINNKTWNWIK